MKIATAADMKRIDEKSVQEHGLTVPKLMEAAGEAVVSVMEEKYGPLDKHTIGVLCGPGHNGGDGLVVARLLKRHKGSVVAVLLADPGDLPEDVTKQFTKAKAAKVPVLSVSEASQMPSFKAAFEECDLLVDALFGTGLSRNMEGLAKEAVQEMNRQKKPVVAVDIPSGMSADTGLPMGDAVRAEWTVSFGLPKIGFYTYAGRTFTGEVKVVNIGFPEALLTDPALKHAVTEEEDVRCVLPHYDENTHKGTRGRLVVVAGATGLTGAACLCALGAQRIGVGLITVACPESLNPILEAKLTEPMTAPVPEVESGFLSLRAAGRIVHLTANVNAVVIGPGIGRHRETGQLLRELLVKLTVPMVVDADALNLLGGQMDIFKVVKTPVILTPHPGEAAWLLKSTITEVEQNRVRVAKQMAAGYNVVVVLKGPHTVIANPQGDVRINPTGNRALATAGTGDVLSGVIGGLLAQRLAPFDAAVAGAYIHGLAGMRASRRFGLDGVLAGDLLPVLPRVLRKVREQGRER
jgi:NAD(P)H-hydrate epimerase